MVRRWLVRCAGFAVVLAAVALLALLGVRQWLRPQVVEGWVPIYQGVDYWCMEVPVRNGEDGRLMALRLHLDAPGLEMRMRPLDEEAVAQGGHYLLAWPDRERSKHDLDILVNSALYTPGRFWESYPGHVVRAVDMVVVHGRATHFWEHSYLLWLDREMRPFMNLSKPPTLADIAAADWGIGLQGVPVQGGKPHYGAIDRRGVPDRFTFIGFDAQARQLFLIAADNVSANTLVETAIRLGVKVGGTMDGGSSTWMLLGPRAKGLRPFTGIRGGRPLGPYIGIRARPLP